MSIKVDGVLVMRYWVYSEKYSSKSTTLLWKGKFMKEFLASLDWMTLLSAIWTVILVPVGTQIYKYLQSKKLDKYGAILYEEVKKAVKSVYETSVKDIKGTDDWTPEKQEEIKELAKTKAIQALNSVVYRSLKEANTDFNDYLDSLIGTALYDVKHEK